MTHRRSTCGKWKVIDGRRRTCRYPRGHTDDCKPVKLLKQAARRQELGRLLAEHAEAECAACDAYTVRVGAGAAPRDALGLRCEWAAGLVQELWPEDYR